MSSPKKGPATSKKADETKTRIVPELTQKNQKPEKEKKKGTTKKTETAPNPATITKANKKTITPDTAGKAIANTQEQVTPASPVIEEKPVTPAKEQKAKLFITCPACFTSVVVGETLLRSIKKIWENNSHPTGEAEPANASKTCPKCKAKIILVGTGIPTMDIVVKLAETQPDVQPGTNDTAENITEPEISLQPPIEVETSAENIQTEQTEEPKAGNNSVDYDHLEPSNQLYAFLVSVRQHIIDQSRFSGDANNTEIFGMTAETAEGFIKQGAYASAIVNFYDHTEKEENTILIEMIFNGGIAQVVVPRSLDNSRGLIIQL